jgi:hypothetical protein
MNTASNLSTVTMEQAIRSAITAAVHQIKTKMYDPEPEDPVQAFLDDLFAVLFPTSVQAVATMPPLLQRTDTLNHTNCDAACCRSEEVTVPTVPAPEAAPAPKEKKPRKKASPKPAVEETPAAAPAPAPKEKKPRKKKEASPAPAPAPAVVEETPAAPAPAVVEETPAAAPAPKEKKPRKKAEPKPASASPAAAPAPTEAPAAPKKEKKAKSPKADEPVPAPAELAPEAPKKEKKVKSPKPEGVNLDKLTPTQVKKLKAVAEEFHVELDKKAFLAHLNAMSGPVFGATTLESHYRSFLQPAKGGAGAATEEAPEKEMDAVEVEFQGKTYYVDESDMRVYEQKGEVYEPVGYVGMAAFKDMEVPTVEDTA